MLDAGTGGGGGGAAAAAATGGGGSSVEPTADRLTELADPVAQCFGQFGQAFGAQHDQGDDGDEQQVDRILDAHPSRLAPAHRDPARREALRHGPYALPVAEPTAAQPASSVARPAPIRRRAVLEPFWPAQATILATIALQLSLPKRLTAGPVWLLPAFEAALLIGMFFASPKELEGEHPRRRAVALGLTALVSAANIYSLAALSKELLHNSPRPERP